MSANLYSTTERTLAESACAAIHGALAVLPILNSPSDVPFLDGLYFFYEEAETSAHGPNGRIVRVGNHPGSEAGLRRRLRNHYSGRKNGSVFRKFLGGALLRKRNPLDPCLMPGPGKGHWERQGAQPCEKCLPLEGEVSKLLRCSFHFRCVMVLDRAERNELEEALVATLAACPVCNSSVTWLGLHAYNKSVRCSGLWNSEFVGHRPILGTRLGRLRQLVDLSAGLFAGGEKQ
jgi:hypothetical protein